MTDRHGALHLYTGPMYSGKTSELVRALRWHLIAETDCLLIRHRIDNRVIADPEADPAADPAADLEDDPAADAAPVTTHDGYSLRGHLVHRLKTTAASRLSEVDAGDYQVIGVDEGQFFPDLADACRRWTEEGRTVYVSALDGDFRREMFASVAAVLPLADTAVKLCGVCMRCRQRKSIFTERTVATTEQVLVGGRESYRAVCRQCYGQ